MSDCKCQSVKIYDGKHRCMKCFKEFGPLRNTQHYKIRYKIDTSNETGKMAEYSYTHRLKQWVKRNVNSKVYPTLY